jgi:hypothetical protein
MENQRDEALWKMAEARAGFKRHFVSYLVINIFFIGIWYFSGGNNGRYFWPIWPILAWGVSLLFHYLGVYRSQSFFSVEGEYEKLIRKS